MFSRDAISMQNSFDEESFENGTSLIPNRRRSNTFLGKRVSRDFSNENRAPLREYTVIMASRFLIDIAATCRLAIEL